MDVNRQGASQESRLNECMGPPRIKGIRERAPRRLCGGPRLFSATVSCLMLMAGDRSSILQRHPTRF